MAKRAAYPFRMLSLILSFCQLSCFCLESEEDSTNDYCSNKSNPFIQISYHVNTPPLKSQPSLKKKLTKSGDNLKRTSPKSTQFLHPRGESAETQHFYEQDYRRNRLTAYPDEGNDSEYEISTSSSEDSYPPYTDSPSSSEDPITSSEGSERVDLDSQLGVKFTKFLETYKENLEELFHQNSDPDDEELKNAFLNTHHQSTIYRSPAKGHKDNNDYYLMRGLTPTKTPRRKDNLSHVKKGTLPIWVNPSTNKVQAYNLHHTTQKQSDGCIVMLPKEFHQQNTKILHPRNKYGSQIDRSRFRSERIDVIKEAYPADTSYSPYKKPYKRKRQSPPPAGASAAVKSRKILSKTTA